MQLDTDLIMICTHDIAGQLRGKAVPRRNLQSRAEAGIGWTPTNVFITSFGPIAPSPWGALGDLYIKPDFSAQVDVNLPDQNIKEAFILGNIKTLDGKAWECCLRSQLASALSRLQEVAVSGGNTFAELMEATKVASLGQISYALYQVGGQYRRNM